MELGNRFILTALLFGLLGMCMGAVMGGMQDFRLSPVHAHVNLLGYVGLFIAGLYYRTAPEAAGLWSAQAHYWMATVGVVLMNGALTLALLGDERLMPVGFFGILLMIIAKVLFIVIVTRAKAASNAAVAVPAE